MSKKSESIKNFIRDIKPWYIFVLLIISSLICIYALRSNNEHMNVLRNDVYSADKNGGNVQQALENLEKYVTSNMNTDLSSGPNGVYPPIQLTYSYSRVNAGQTSTEEQQNSALYTDAENYCQTVVPTGFSGRYRVPCIEQYITSHSLDNSNVASSLYEFDFISPTWSPDLAGWSLLATILLGITFVASLLLKRYWNKQEKKSYKG